MKFPALLALSCATLFPTACAFDAIDAGGNTPPAPSPVIVPPPPPGAPNPVAPPEGTNVGFGGDQDFGFVRGLIEAGQVPPVDAYEASGFFAEHHTPLPSPECGERMCVQAMYGVMNNLTNGTPCTILQLGINSPLTIDPEDRPPLTLAVAVDTSGSMAGADKMAFTRDGLHHLIDTLRDNDELAIIRYSESAEVLTELAATGGRRADLHAAVDTLTEGGSTALYDGLELAFQTLQSSEAAEGRALRAILISDGQPSDHSAGEILTMSASYTEGGIGLSSIGVGLDFNYALMSGLARRGDGNFYFVEDAAAVEEVFADEVEFFAQPIAFDIEINVQMLGDHELGGVFGAPDWETTEQGGRLTLDSAYLAHRRAHDDVTEEGGRRGGGSALLLEVMPGLEGVQDNIAAVSLTYREPGTDEALIEDSRLIESVPLTGEMIGHFDNTIVEKSFVMLNIFAAMVEASTAFHSGFPDDGAVALELVAAAVEDYEDSANGGEGDVDMQLDLELLRQLRDNVMAGPVDAPIGDDPWPMD